MKMQLLTWNNAKPTPGPDTRPASSIVVGLDVAEKIRASGVGRKMFLTTPFIDRRLHSQPEILNVGLAVVHLVMCGAGFQFEQEILIEVVVFCHADIISGEGADCRLRFPERDHQEMCDISLDTT